MSLHELRKKTSDGIDVEMLRSVLRFYGLGGRQIDGIESFHVNSRACVRVGNSMSDWFCVKVGLYQRV